MILAVHLMRQIQTSFEGIGKFAYLLDLHLLVLDPECMSLVDDLKETYEDKPTDSTTISATLIH